MAKSADNHIEQTETAQRFKDAELEILDRKYVAPILELKTLAEHTPEDYQAIVEEAEEREIDLESGWTPQ